LVGTKTFICLRVIRYFAFAFAFAFAARFAVGAGFAAECAPEEG
jgi:hypothetical protein